MKLIWLEQIGSIIIIVAMNATKNNIKSSIIRKKSAGSIKMKMKPKSENLNSFLEKMSGVKRDGTKCTWCESNKIKEEDFRDDLSREEFCLSGFCQKCQDTIF